MKPEAAQYWKITFEGLVLDRRMPSFEGEFDLLDALENYGMNILEQEQGEAKYDFWRVKVRLRVYRQEPVHKATLRSALKDFDILSLRITPE